MFPTLYKLLLLALGGAVGTLCRYGTSTAFSRLMDKSVFPLGTLAVNLLGCLLIGYLNGLFTMKLLRPEWQLACVVGFLGGYTTFSSYGWETVSLLQEGSLARAAINILASNVVGLLLVMLGYALSRLQS